MATTSVQISADYNGKTLDVLQELIAKRNAALRETTAASVVATAINILRSLRTDTRVADPKRAGDFLTVVESANYDAGWYSDGTSRHRCVRSKGVHGPVVMRSGFVNIAGRHVPGETPHVYVVVDMAGSQVGKNMQRRYFVIAKNLKDAKDYAVKRKRRRLEKFRGMARWTLGRAMYNVSAANGGGLEAVQDSARRVGMANLDVSVDESGWSSGSVTVKVDDRLNYASRALKGGEASFDLAVKKAANKTAGLIHLAYADRKFDEDVTTPFPEVQRKR